jgi:hypothetical protein
LYKQILKNAKLQIGERGQTAELTERGPGGEGSHWTVVRGRRRRRRIYLRCGTALGQREHIGEESRKHIFVASSKPTAKTSEACTGWIYRVSSVLDFRVFLQSSCGSLQAVFIGVNM